MNVKNATIDQVCEHYQLKKSKVYKMVEDGRIGCKRIGRELRFDIEKLDKEFEVKAVGINA